VAAHERFARLDPGDPAGADAVDRAVAVMVSERGAAGLPVRALVSRAGLDPGAVRPALERLERAGTAVRAGEALVSPSALDGLARAVLRLLGDHHRAEPLSEGMPREEVRERLFARAGDGVFDHVLAGLQGARTVGGRERLALASHRVSLSPEEEQARQVTDETFRTAGLTPPDPHDVGQLHGIPGEVMDRVTKLLVRQRVLVKLDTVYFHQQALQQLKRDVAALKDATVEGPARIDVGTFKSRFGVSRKYAIPLLEYLDRERITRRVGDARMVI
jgi:selenocysteine-specific elongation factor